MGKVFLESSCATDKILTRSVSEERDVELKRHRYPRLRFGLGCRIRHLQQNILTQPAKNFTHEVVLPSIEYPLEKNHFDANASWLLTLRWIAVVGQLATIAVVRFGYGVPLPLAPLAVIVAVTAATNLGFGLWLTWYGKSARSIQTGRYVLLAVMALDLLLLTALLYFSGGPVNPFAVFYFVNLSLSAVILPSRWSWSLTALALVCFAFLFFVYQPLPELWRQNDFLSIQQQGLAVAITTCATVTVYFITRISRELRIREEQLRTALEQQSNSRRLESLATLAAGAGHELATPLSTIAVVTRELTNELEGAPVSENVLTDVALIRSEVDHCRRILNRMAGNAGQMVGEEFVSVAIADFVAGALAEMRTADRIEVKVDNSIANAEIDIPRQNMEQALRGILQNGLDASSPDQPISLRVSPLKQGVRFVISDRGQGMSPETLARAGEPFFTTKEPDQGMGLGLFLSRNVIEMVQGSLTFESTLGEGTTATIWLPR